MRRLRDLVRKPADEFPDGLARTPPPPVLPRRYALLAVLLLICLVPRIWAACRWNVLWSDSIVYLHVSEALKQGDFNAAFDRVGLNTFPVILMCLRRTGLDWTVLGEWWSVLVATLAVLPLFGWIRRQFDDQVAFVGCLLYAVHPKLVGYTPLIIRDPTYWLLFSLTLYLIWRAVTEVRWWLFAAAGASLTLTVYTRSEGWLLLVPLLLWAVWRLPAASGSRVRLALGTVTCLAMIPLLVVLVNITWLKDHSRWEIGRLDHLKMVWSWLVSSAEQVLDRPVLAAEPTPARCIPPEGDISPAPAASRMDAGSDAVETNTVGNKPPSSQFTPTVLCRKVVLRLLKALTYGYGLLLVVGLYGWRRVFCRRDQQALFAYGLLLFFSVWVYYARYKGIDIRYFLSIVLIALPYLALGLLGVAEWIVQSARRYSLASPRRRAAVVFGLLLATAAVGMPDATLSSRPVMTQQTELGRWILRHVGPDQTVLGPSSCLELLAYHAQARAIAFPPSVRGGGEALLDVIRVNDPAIIFVWDDLYNPNLFALSDTIARQCTELGYEPISSDRLPPCCSGVRLFVARRPPSKQPSRAPQPKFSRKDSFIRWAREIPPWQGNLVLDLPVSNADGKPVTYTVAVVTDQQRAYVLDQRLGLTAPDWVRAHGYYEGTHLRQHERYVRGANGVWHYLLPNGEFHSGDGSKTTMLSPRFHEDPRLLAEAADGGLSPPPMPARVEGNRVTLEPAAGYLGSAWVTVTADDGHEQVAETLAVVVRARDSFYDPTRGTQHVAFDPAGDPYLTGETLPAPIVVCEELSKQVKCIEPDGAVRWVREFAGWPTDCAYADGFLYVVDGTTLHVITPDDGCDLTTYSFPKPLSCVSVSAPYLVLTFDQRSPVELWRLSPDMGGVALAAATRMPGHYARKAIYDGRYVTVADTFWHRVFREDLATGELSEFHAYYPNDVQQVGPDKTLVTIEHENKVVIYDWATGRFNYVFGANFHTFSRAEPDWAIGETEAQTAVPYGEFLISKAAVEFSGKNTLYSPNRAVRLSENEYLISDTDNHRVVVVRSGAVVSEIHPFNTPTGIAVLPQRK